MSEGTLDVQAQVDRWRMVQVLLALDPPSRDLQRWEDDGGAVFDNSEDKE